MTKDAKHDKWGGRVDQFLAAKLGHAAGIHGRTAPSALGSSLRSRVFADWVRPGMICDPRVKGAGMESLVRRVIS